MFAQLDVWLESVDAHDERSNPGRKTWGDHRRGEFLAVVGDSGKIRPQSPLNLIHRSIGKNGEMIGILMNDFETLPRQPIHDGLKI